MKILTSGQVEGSLLRGEEVGNEVLCLCFVVLYMDFSCASEIVLSGKL